MEDLKHVIGKKTSVVAAKECLDQLKAAGAAEVKGVSPGDKVTVLGVGVEVLAAYNTNKKFHPKGDGKVGYVITAGNMRIYHTGDTDDIPEMSAAKPDVALVPVSGTYVMTAEEAARAVNEKIKPKKLAIPMHYGSIVGSEQDAMKFKELVTVCSVEILNRV
jgi:L-ascorbate metabolism protein UlaG (beta-lactamase superfamily)